MSKTYYEVGEQGNSYYVGRVNMKTGEYEEVTYIREPKKVAAHLKKKALTEGAIGVKFPLKDPTLIDIVHNELGV